MIIIKGCLIISIIIICSLIGNIKSNSYRKRYDDLKKFKRALGVFKTKLEFTYQPINEIFEDISKLVYEEKDNVFKRFNENEDWDLSVDMEENFMPDDKEVAKNLGKLLGKLDKDGQLNEIYLVNSFIDKQIEVAFDVRQKNEKLYRILGKSVGIAIAIVLI